MLIQTKSTPIDYLDQLAQSSSRQHLKIFIFPLHFDTTNSTKTNDTFVSLFHKKRGKNNNRKIKALERSEKKRVLNSKHAPTGRDADYVSIPEYINTKLPKFSPF